MHATNLLQVLRRCGRLKRAERDLARQLRRRLTEVGNTWHARDSAYRRLWDARMRVQAELHRTEDALNRRFQGGLEQPAAILSPGGPTPHE